MSREVAGSSPVRLTPRTGSSAARAPDLGPEVGGSSPPPSTNLSAAAKLYVAVRDDLPAGVQLAQACHALRAFVEAHPEVDRQWYEHSNNLVVVCVRSEGELLRLYRKADDAGIAVAAFSEPDLHDHWTAIAIAPDGARLCSSLPLALRDR